MLLIRTDSKVESTWYCKPTDTGLIMNFHALAPKRYKRGVVNGFVHRIFRASSNWLNFHQSMEKAKQILRKNQYPDTFFEPIVKQTIEKIRQPQNFAKTTEEDNKAKYRIKLQYRGFATNQFKKCLNECGAPVEVVLTTKKLRSCLPSLKVPVPKMLKSNLIYKITCPRCSTCYVGKTCRHLTDRLEEHKSKANEPVRRHFTTCGVDRVEIMNNTEVLQTVVGTSFHLSIMEALYIRELKPAINTKDEYRDYNLVISLY